MFNSFATVVTFLRARWRWARGRCPRCNRNLYATFPYTIADYPNCLVCKNETEADGHLWHKYSALAAFGRSDVVPVRVENEWKHRRK